MLPSTLAGTASDRLANQHGLVSIGEGRVVGLARRIARHGSIDRPIQRLEGIREAFVVSAR